MKNSQETSIQTFGEFFRQKRLASEMTLRSFCQRYGYDPGNISRIERNILSPSLNDEKLAGYAAALKIKRESEEWVKFYDLAHTAKGRVPKDITKDKDVKDMLPAFFRTMRNKKLDRKKLEKLIKLLNE